MIIGVDVGNGTDMTAYTRMEARRGVLVLLVATTPDTTVVAEEIRKIRTVTNELKVFRDLLGPFPSQPVPPYFPPRWAIAPPIRPAVRRPTHRAARNDGRRATRTSWMAKARRP